MSEAERIAAGLTKAQREAVLSAQEAAWGGKDNFLISTKVRTNTWRKLVEFWLIDPSAHTRSLTPLGLAVRAILERQARP